AIQQGARASINSGALTMLGATGSFGTQNAPILISNGTSGDLKMNAIFSGTGGSSFVRYISSGNVNLISSQVLGGTFYVNNTGGNVSSGSTSAGIALVPGPNPPGTPTVIQAATVTLDTSSSNGHNSGGISFGDFSVQASTAANFVAGGTGNITQTGTTQSVIT